MTTRQLLERDPRKAYTSCVQLYEIWVPLLINMTRLYWLIFAGDRKPHSPHLHAQNNYFWNPFLWPTLESMRTRTIWTSCGLSYKNRVWTACTVGFKNEVGRLISHVWNAKHRSFELQVTVDTAFDQSEAFCLVIRGVNKYARSTIHTCIQSEV